MMRSSLGITSRLSFVNHLETYGPNVIRKISKSVQADTCLDIGAGNGRDLSIVKETCGASRLYAVDFRPDNRNLAELGCTVFNIDVEKEEIPLDDESLDLVIANQTMEHVKEIYWINHQVFKKLAVGGYFVMGVPNLLAFHNRLLPIFGIHPTCIKMLSAHIRGYSIRDTRKFYEAIGNRFLSIEAVYGSQFYPLPTRLSRVLSGAFPGLSTSIFFKIKKKSKYRNEFQEWTWDHALETNFFTGK